MYRVKRNDDQNVYAVKETDVTKMSQDERQDAANEIRLLASVKHPNIVRYYETFLDGNWLCIIMEYAQCGDLSHYIKKGKERRAHFPEEIIWQFIIQIMRVWIIRLRHSYKAAWGVLAGCLASACTQCLLLYRV